jgi:hypothetical protein
MAIASGVRRKHDPSFSRLAEELLQTLHWLIQWKTRQPGRLRQNQGGYGETRDAMFFFESLKVAVCTPACATAARAGDRDP